MPLFTSIAKNLITRFSKMVRQNNLNSITFCRHGLKMIWLNFRENQSNSQGGVRKNMFFIKFKMMEHF